MTDTPRPIEPDAVDELLSADLDGELDAAARDLGYEPDDVHAAIAADPELRARRDALERARAELARVPTLDDVSAARLRATALAGAKPSSPRRGRLLAVSSGLAAAVAIVVAVVAVTHSTHESVKTAAGSVAAPRTAVVAPGTGGSRAVVGVDFGTVPNIDALAARAATSSAAHTQTDLAGGSSTSNTDSAEIPAASGSAPFDAKALAAPCQLQSMQLAGAGATLVVRGTATLADRLVIVSLFARPGKANVLVVLERDCKLVGTRNVPTPSP